ncbi:GlsB/YeaQ/YmgE family stress response membrane protein [bacterium]|nr:GlsB/YeaQ/YmgE family stress response membrane protein [bacterium]
MDFNFLGISGNTIIIWLVLGLIVGILAKYILPGKDPGGVLTTSLTGIAGAFIGGIILNHFGFSSELGSLELINIFIAIMGAVVLLIALRVLRFLI